MLACAAVGGVALLALLRCTCDCSSLRPQPLGLDSLMQHETLARGRGGLALLPRLNLFQLCARVAVVLAQ
jgi:hypothetical protein